MKKLKARVNTMHVVVVLESMGISRALSIHQNIEQSQLKKKEARQKSSPFHKQKSFRDVNHRLDSPFVDRSGLSVGNASFTVYRTYEGDFTED